MNRREEQDVLDIADVNIEMLSRLSKQIHNALKIENRTPEFKKAILTSLLTAMEISKRLNDKFYQLATDLDGADDENENGNAD